MYFEKKKNMNSSIYKTDKQFHRDFNLNLIYLN